MQTEQLIQQIVQDVLKRLQPAVKECCVLVVGKRDASVEAKIRAALSFCHEDAPDIVFSGECCSGRAPKRILLPFLSVSDMADLASGKAGNEAVKEILGHLLNGEVVEVLEFEYRRYASTAPASLYKLYAAYENTLKSFGLHQFQSTRTENIKVHAALVTAADIEKASQDGAHYIDVPSKAIITPLAAETAESLGIGIRRQG